jgi:hypothetical protein
MRFRGVFDRARNYHQGDVTILDGRVWCALRQLGADDTRPGDTGSTGWQLLGRTR